MKTSDLEDLKKKNDVNSETKNLFFIVFSTFSKACGIFELLNVLGDRQEGLFT